MRYKAKKVNRRKKKRKRGSETNINILTYREGFPIESWDVVDAPQGNLQEAEYDQDDDGGDQREHRD